MAQESLNILKNVTKIKPDENLPHKLLQLLSGIRKAPETLPLLLEFVSPEISFGLIRQNLKYITEYRLQGSAEAATKGRISDNPDLGFNIKANKLILDPVDIRPILEKAGLPEVLLHNGFMSFGTVTEESTIYSEKQVKEHGVVGKRPIEMASYLHVWGQGFTAKDYSDGREPFCLWVSPNRLNSLRTIFAAPDALASDKKMAELGKVFFVMGGIPAQSILGVSVDEMSPVTLV